MADEQQCLGEPYILDWNGRKLKFGPVQEGMKAALVAAAKLDAVREFNENLKIRFAGNDQESIGQRAAYAQEFEDNMITGAWRWGGRLFEKWRLGSVGARHFTESLLVVNGITLTEDELRQLTEEKAEDVASIFILCCWDIMNPKAKRPAILVSLAEALKSRTSTPN